MTDLAERPQSASAARSRLLALALVFAGVVAVVVLARRPPILDLPQQLDQIRLLGEVLEGERPDLKLNLAGPNKLGYVPLALADLVASPKWTPRIAVALVALVWLAAVHAIGAITRRAIASVLLASTLLFSTAFYAGFFNFVVGMAALCYWTWELRPERREGSAGRIFLSSLVGVLLLYLAHGIWLLVGGFAIATLVMLHRFRPREVLARAGALVLLAPLAISASRDLDARGWQTWSEVGVRPIERVTDLDLAAGLFYGGLRGPLEAGLLLAIVAWIGAAVASAATDRWRGVDPFLLIAAVVFLLVAVFAPYRVDRTIYFAWRWGAPALVAALLALPAPRLGSRLSTILASTLLLLQLATTAVAWARFERTEMSGFEECLRALPEGAALYGLDWRLHSPEFRIGSSVQMYAYAGVEKQARLSFSFAEFGSSLVVRAEPGGTTMLDEFLLMKPRFLRPSHLAGYTHVLVHGAPEIARAYEEQTDLLGIAAGRQEWHLLEIRPERPQSAPGSRP